MKFSELPQDYSYDSSYGSYPECLEPGESYWFSLKKDNLSLSGEFINETDQIIPYNEAVVKKLIIHYETQKEDVIDRYTHRKANRLILYKGINIYTSNSKRYKLLSDEEGFILLPSNYKTGPQYEYYASDAELEIHLIIDEIDYLYFHYLYSSIGFTAEISSE